MTDNTGAVTAAQMKEIEKKANDGGLSYLQMMENAGNAAYKIIKDRYREAESFLVFAGKGNNGGDGFVVSRLAAEDEKKVRVVLVEGEPATGDAAANFNLLKGLPAEIISIDDAPGNIDADIIVDAIYGTGFKGQLRPAGKKACGLINSASGSVIALDIPSGVNCDSAKAADGAVKADLTISFHAYKYAHLSEEAAAYCSESILADIGIRL